MPTFHPQRCDFASSYEIAILHVDNSKISIHAVEDAPARDGQKLLYNHFLRKKKIRKMDFSTVWLDEIHRKLNPQESLSLTLMKFTSCLRYISTWATHDGPTRLRQISWLGS